MTEQKKSQVEIGSGQGPAVMDVTVVAQPCVLKRPILVLTGCSTGSFLSINEFK